MIELALGLSLHLGLVNSYNEVHPHVRYKTEDNYIAGVYYNSVRNISTYAGKRWEYNDWGIEGALVTGYPQADVVPFVRGTYKNFFIAPAMEEDKPGVVVGIELKF